MQMLKWPDAVDFSFKPSKKTASRKTKGGATVRRLEERLYDFVYIERFDDHNEAIMKRTLAMMKGFGPAMGLKSKRAGKNGIRIFGTVPRGVLCDMLVGEFLPGSGAGKITLGQMLEAMALGAVAHANITSGAMVMK